MGQTLQMCPFGLVFVSLPVLGEEITLRVTHQIHIIQATDIADSETHGFIESTMLHYLIYFTGNSCSVRLSIVGA